jgi:hypothetical protein
MEMNDGEEQATGITAMWRLSDVSQSFVPGWIIAGATNIHSIGFDAQLLNSGKAADDLYLIARL